jgi:hypothetical protein
MSAKKSKKAKKPQNLHEPRHPTLLDSLVAPQYEKEETDQFEQVYKSQVAEKIEAPDFDEALNFSNGLMMIKFVEEAIEKLKNGG